MIKKTGALLLILLYVLTTSGIVVNMHYCGHLLVSVRVNAPSKPLPGRKREMKACSDKQLTVKVKDAHQSTTFSFAPKKHLYLPCACCICRASFTHTIFVERLLGRAPPDSPCKRVPRL